MDTKKGERERCCTNFFVVPFSLSDILAVHSENFLNLLHYCLRHEISRRKGKGTRRAYDFFFLGFVRQARITQTPAHLLKVLQCLFNPLDILQPKFCLNNFHITDWIDISFDVNNFSIIKCTNDLKNSIDGANM